MQLAIEAVLSIHLDREPTTLVDQENHVHLKGLWDNKIAVGQKASHQKDSSKRKEFNRIAEPTLIFTDCERC